MGVEIRTLVDTTDTYTKQGLKEFFASPFRFTLEPRPVIALIFGGYLFKIFMPNKKIPERESQISKKTKVYLSKDIEILSIPEIANQI